MHVVITTKWQPCLWGPVTREWDAIWRVPSPGPPQSSVALRHTQQGQAEVAGLWVTGPRLEQCLVLLVGVQCELRRPGVDPSFCQLLAV